VLIGAWEVWIGPEAGCGVYQIRQFESLAAWEQHRERVHRDASLNDRYRSNLSPSMTSWKQRSSSVSKSHRSFQRYGERWILVRGMPRGFYEQRTLYFRPGTSAAHHRVYFEQLVPALERDGARLQAFFDTVIGPGTTNTVRTEASNCGDFPTWRVAALA